MNIQFADGGGFRSHLPSYLSQDGLQTSSTGSNDSVMTQVPLSYHLPTSDSPFSTPVIQQGDGRFEDFRHSGHPSKSLNPNSATYVPNNSLASTNQGFGGFGQQFGVEGMYSQNGMNPYHRQGNDNGQGVYEYAQLTPATIMTAVGVIGGSGPAYEQPYDLQLPSGFQNYSNNLHSNSYSSYGSGSSVMSYSTTSTSMPQTRVEQNPPHGPANGSYSSSTYSSVNPSDMYRGPRGQRNSFSYGHGSLLPPRMSRKRSVSDFQPPSSSFENAPVKNYSSLRLNNSFPTPTLGTPVRQTAASSRSGSPIKSAHTPTRSSSAAPTSRTSEEPASPAPQSHSDLSFMSEPHNAEFRKRNEAIPMTTQNTPVLRSRAGQSVANLNKDSHSPAGSESSGGSTRSLTFRRDTVDFFSDPILLKNLEDKKLDNKQSRHQAPPKMLNLLAPGGVDASALSPITALTTSKSNQTRSRPAYNDPFGPSPSMLTPWTPNSHFGPGEASRALISLTNSKTGKPTVDVALDPNNFPFEEYCRQPKPDMWGVIKIKNIPYSVARAEVMAFLGRNARIIDERDNEPVHIVMERVTSKTLDCYVEFVSFNEAVGAVNRFETNRTGGRGGRLGQRHVEVELSSQEALMKDLFPKAKNVKWIGSRPEVIPHDPNDPYNSGFQGFVSKEELVMLVKHVEAPQRSPFSKDCPQRPFECLISTLLKYPWYMVDFITIEDRNLLFQATKDLLNLLVERVHNGREDVHLTPMLLKRAWRVALRCPGFTPTQKDDIVCICSIDDRTGIELGMAPHASYWKILWTIGPKPGVPYDLLMYYCAVIREATEGTQERLSLAERAARGDDRTTELKLFGDLKNYIHYNPEQALLYQTLAAVAKAEWTAIEQVLRMALTPAIEG